MQKLLLVFLGVLLVGVGIVIGSNVGRGENPLSQSSPNQTPESAVSPTNNNSAKVKVIKVVDGDTVALSSGETLRYIGIDTPERGNCFFEEAKLANEKLVLGKEVELEKDVSETDKYKRLLRYAWVGNTIVNEQLVKGGYATVSTYPPDVKYQDKFLAAQKEAREAGRGIWGEGVCSNGMSNVKSQMSNSSSGVAGSNTEDKDCGDFKTHREAQDFFISAGGPGKDPHKLDRDGDGVACETLP